MEIFDIVVMALLVLLVIILFILAGKNTTLAKKNKKLQEILELKNVTIANYEASRVAVSDVIENFSSLDDVMALIDAGESKASVSKKLNMPLSKVELIIKFDKLKHKKD
jgi:ribosomal protein L30E